MTVPLHGIPTLSKANAGWEGLCGQMILRAMPVVALATGRATLERSKVMAQMKGDTLVLQVGGWAWG